MIFASWFNHIRYGASEILAHFADFFGAGVINPTTHFSLSFPVTPPMSATVGSGVARVDGYRIYNDGVDPVTLTFAEADATYSRIDLVQVGPVDESGVDIRLGTAQNLGRVYIKQGTASASPECPAADAHNVPLYSVLVGAGQTSLSPSDVTDLRALVPFFFTALNSPMSAIGDMIFGGVAGAMVRLPGNTTDQQLFLSQTGTGGAATEPVWSPITATNLPTLDLIPAPAANVDMNNKRMVNMAEPVDLQDGATRNFVLGLASQFASQFAGIKLVSSTVTLDSSYAKQLTVCSGTTYTIILPQANTYTVGKNLTFMSIASGTLSLEAAGLDALRVSNGSTISSITLGAGDTLTLVSNGANEWYAVTGSVQYAGYSAAFQTSLGQRLQAYPGMLMQFAGGAAPTGWLLCDGSAVSRTTYAALFDVVGTTYGIGNGSSTFNVPDLRGKAAIGVGTGAVGAVPLTNRVLGSEGGAEGHILGANEMPSHNHSVSDPGHTHPYNVPDISPNGNNGTGTNIDAGDVTLGQTTSSAVTGISIGSTGSGARHNNMSPWCAVNFIIKW